MKKASFCTTAAAATSGWPAACSRTTLSRESKQTTGMSRSGIDRLVGRRRVACVARHEMTTMTTDRSQ